MINDGLIALWIWLAFFAGFFLGWFAKGLGQPRTLESVVRQLIDGLRDGTITLTRKDKTS